MADIKTIGTSIDRQFRNDINDNFKAINDSNNSLSQTVKSTESLAIEAKAISLKAETKAEQTQDQLDDIILKSGDSSSEVVQARGGESLLYKRLDKTDAQLADKASKSDLNNLTSNKADKSYVDSSIVSLDAKINSQTSGSPKGVYATLSDLQSAIPSGNSNIYVVTADGKWYFWSGSAWVPGGNYQSTGIERKSVTDIFAEESGLKINTITTQAKTGSKNLYTERIYDVSNVSDTFLLRLKTKFKSASSNVSKIWAQAWVNNSPTPSDLTNATPNTLPTLPYSTNTDLLYDKSLSITKGSNRYLHLFIRVDLTTEASAATFTLSEILITADGNKLVPVNDFSGFNNNYQSYSNIITYKSDDVVTKEKLPDILSTEGYLKNNEGDALVGNVLSRLTDKIQYTISGVATGTNTVIHSERVYDLSALPQQLTMNIGTDFKAITDSFMGMIVKIFINDDATPGVLTDAIRNDLPKEPYTFGAEISYQKTVTVDKGTKKYMHIYFAPQLKTSGGSGTFNLIDPYVEVNGKRLTVKNDFTGYLVDNFTSSKTIVTSPLTTEDKVNSLIESKLKNDSDWGKMTWNVEGDSLTEINYQSTKFYHQYVKDWLGIPLVNNYGVSGSTLNAVYSRRANMNKNADIITVWIGTNDAKNSTPIGTINDNTTSTFYGTLNLMSDFLLNTFPNKRVGFITLHIPAGTYYQDPNTAGHSTEDYADAMIAVGRKYSIPVLDLYHEGGFTLKNPTQNSLLATDGLHLNALGHERVARKVKTFLNIL